MTSNPIYLDNNATTAIDPRVLEVVVAELKGTPANPSSVHAYGQAARNKLTRARRSIAERFGVHPQEVIFTSGGTEGINLVLRGLLNPGDHLIVGRADHMAILKTADSLEGVTVSKLPPGQEGALDSSRVEAAILPQTRCIATAAVNSETGVMSDVSELAAVAEERSIPLVVDGVALLGKERFAIPDGVSAILFSGHKIHAPKGVGVAVIRKRLKLRPQITGGGQEYERRAGTENLASIMGLAKAIELADDAIGEASELMRRHRDRLEEAILSKVPGTVVNGSGRRVSNASNISFIGRDAEALMMSLDLAGLLVSHASACASGSLEPSHVIEAMGLGRERAMTSLRFSLSRFTTLDEIDRAVQLIIESLGL